MPDSGTDLPERITLRYWPWLVLCLLGALSFGLLAWLAVYVMLNTASGAVLIIAALFAVGLAILAGYSLLSLRTRSVLDRTGSRVVGAVSRDQVTWRTVEKLDVVHHLPGWAVRAWQDGAATVVYVCHDTRGRRPRSSTHDSPPPEAPNSLRTGYILISRFWRAARDIRPEPGSD